MAVTTGTPGDWITLGGGLCLGIHQLSCSSGPGPWADQGLALEGRGGHECGGGTLSAVPAPFVAAREEEVGCLWAWGQGAHRRVRGSCQLLCPLQCPCLVQVELLGSGVWEAARVLLLGWSVHFPRPGPKERPSEVFPEAHFLWAAQEVVLEWD